MNNNNFYPEEKLEAFLKELAELTEKYQLCIGGCGCCGSPWVYSIESGNNFCIDDLMYDSNTKKYTFR